MPWKLPESDAALLRLATGYPYPAPDGSYLFIDGETRPLESGVGDALLYRERIPVISHGSNRSPEQLRRKFGKAAEIPVSRAWLEDYDVVYSAHMTRYGAIAANLAHQPGVCGEVWVTWLDQVQLQRMHDTELGAEIYRYGTLSGIRLALEAGPRPEIAEAGVYLSSYGYLALDGQPVGLAAVPAEGRRARALAQDEALNLVRERHRPSCDVDQMILAAVRDQDERLSLIEQMRAEALPPKAPHFRESEV